MSERPQPAPMLVTTAVKPPIEIAATVVVPLLRLAPCECPRINREHQNDLFADGNSYASSARLLERSVAAGSYHFCRVVQVPWLIDTPPAALSAEPRDSDMATSDAGIQRRHSRAGVSALLGQKDLCRGGTTACHRSICIDGPRESSCPLRGAHGRCDGDLTTAATK